MPQEEEFAEEVGTDLPTLPQSQGPDVPEDLDIGPPPTQGFANGQPPRDDGRLAARLAQLEQQLAYQQGLLASQQQQQAPRARPLTVDDLRTPQDWDRYIQQHAAQAVQAAQYQAHGVATQAAGESRARGLFNNSEMGAGYDYDSVVSKYISPLESTDPVFAQVIANQRDPAMARFFLGLMHHAAERNGGDPVRTAKALISALGAEQRGADTLKKQIVTAARRGADRIGGASGQAAALNAGRVKASDVWNLSDKDFRKLDDSMEY
jgi:hypothetical protein